jgi:hypothetical protein
MTQSNSNLSTFEPWETVKFPWGCAVRHRASKKWSTLILNGTDPQTIDLEKDNINVILHDNGIEFI